MAGETLEELEGAVWGESEYDSHLVLRCHRLRKKPLLELNAEDLRILIGQGIGLPHLIPQALDLLEQDPLAEGNHCPGDLLASVVRAKSFVSITGLIERLSVVVSRAIPLLSDDQEELRRELIGFTASTGGS